MTAPTGKFALIIANGESCRFDLTKEFVNNAETVIVLDGAMHRYQQLDLPAHVLLGDFDDDSHNQAALKEKFPRLEIKHAPDQEATDFEKGIWHAINQGYEHIVALWATGRRADHSFTNVANLIRFPKHVRIELIDEHSLIYRLPKYFQKEFKKGAVVSLVPIGDVHGVRTENLKYPLNNESLHLGLRNGNSNEPVNDGLVTISYESGEMLLMECYD